MDLTESLAKLVQVSQPGASAPRSLREAAAAVALSIAKSVTDGTGHDIGGTLYTIEEVTWPVSRFEDGSQAFHSPRPKPALIREGALLADVREDYWDGWATYHPVDTRVGRWRWFRMSSPGDRGYDLHLATDEEVATFAGEVGLVIETFGLSEGGTT